MIESTHPSGTFDYLKSRLYNVLRFIASGSFVLSFIVIFPFHSEAIDLVRITKPHSEIDQRHVYNNTVLTEALKNTVDKYGDFEIEQTVHGLSRDRALKELLSGQLINVHIVPTRQEWEEKTIPIRIPIVKGLLSYRLFFIKNQDVEKFSKVSSLDELKALRAGLGLQWSTTKAMQPQGFDIVTGDSYEGLFNMLSHRRFDYFPRGVNEIFEEAESRRTKYPDIVIEPSKALYLPQPTYLFVSPQYPKLAQRIKEGLEGMIQDGSFDKIFWKHHKNNITKAALNERTIFSIDNPELSPQTPWQNKKLWLDLDLIP